MRKIPTVATNPLSTTAAEHATILDEIVRRLVATYNPLRIYLFGSSARGDGGADSDFDLMVVVPDGTPANVREPGRAYRALWGVGAPADVLVWTSSAFDDRRHLRASLPGTILREGRLVYGE